MFKGGQRCVQLVGPWIRPRVEATGLDATAAPDGLTGGSMGCDESDERCEQDGLIGCAWAVRIGL